MSNPAKILILYIHRYRTALQLQRKKNNHIAKIRFFVCSAHVNFLSMKKKKLLF